MTAAAAGAGLLFIGLVTASRYAHDAQQTGHTLVDTAQQLARHIHYHVTGEATQQ